VLIESGFEWKSWTACSGARRLRNQALGELTLGNSPEARVRRSSNVVSRVVADEAIVIPIRRGAADMDSIFTFNEAGTKLWSLISEGQSPATLAAHLEAEYGLTPQQAANDAAAFIGELQQEGLVETA